MGEFVMVPRELLKKWQRCALRWKIDGIGIEIMDVLQKPAEQHHGEPVAWLYRDPDGNARDQLTDSRATEEERGRWREIPLYAHVAPGEVERLRKENDQLRGEAHLDGLLRVRYGGEIDTLRAQLAEAQALLRRISGPDHQDSLKAIGEAAALSASVEPSAPVVRDERAEFEAHYLLDHVFESADFEMDGDRYVWQATQDRWEAWQARAALERKP